MAASFPNTYLKSGLSDVTACRMTFATSDGCIALCDHCLKYSDIFFSIDLYVAFKGSDDYVAFFQILQKVRARSQNPITDYKTS